MANALDPKRLHHVTVKGKEYTIYEVHHGEAAPWSGLHYFTGLSEVIKNLKDGRIQNMYFPDGKLPRLEGYQSHYAKAGETGHGAYMLVTPGRPDEDYATKPEWGEVSP